MFSAQIGQHMEICNFSITEIRSVIHFLILCLIGNSKDPNFKIYQYISIERKLNLCTFLKEKYTHFACVNNKRCIAYQNLYTQFVCN